MPFQQPNTVVKNYPLMDSTFDLSPGGNVGIDSPRLRQLYKNKPKWSFENVFISLAELTLKRPLQGFNAHSLQAEKPYAILRQRANF